MTDTAKQPLSARVDAEILERLDVMARAEGVTRSVLVEQLLQKVVRGKTTFNGPDGAVPMTLVSKLNADGMSRPIDHQHPGVELWECDEDVWPRHFIHVFAEYDIDGGGSSEVWLLWQGNKVKMIDPDKWMKKARRQ